jgi:hypothetical protein
MLWYGCVGPSVGSLIFRMVLLFLFFFLRCGLAVVLVCLSVLDVLLTDERQGGTPSDWTSEVSQLPASLLLDEMCFG